MMTFLYIFFHHIISRALFKASSLSSFSILSTVEWATNCHGNVFTANTGRKKIPVDKQLEHHGP